jgi:hypothetical protein
VVTGSAIGDQFITIDAGHTLTVLAAVTAGASASATVAAVNAAAAAAQYDVAYSQYGGNTYIAEAHAAANTAASITNIELVGLHTIVGSGAADGIFKVLT